MSPIKVNPINNNKTILDDRSIDSFIQMNGKEFLVVSDEEIDLNLLHFCCSFPSKNRNGIIKHLLMNHSMDPNIKSGIGNDLWTSGHICSCWGYDDTLKILLKNGLNPFQTDSKGFNLWDISQIYDHFNCLKLLEDFLDDQSLDHSNDQNNVHDDTQVEEEEEEEISLEGINQEEEEKDQNKKNQKVYFDKKFGFTFIQEIIEPINKEEVDHHQEAIIISQGSASSSLNVTSSNYNHQSNDNKNQVIQESIREEIKSLNDEELRRRLIKDFGENPGPVTSTTKRLYQRKLQRLLDSKGSSSASSLLVTNESSIKNEEQSNQQQETKKEEEFCCFSKELNSLQNLVLSSTSNVVRLNSSILPSSSSSPPRRQEVMMFEEAKKIEKEFLTYFKNESKKFYFNYLLLDPKILLFKKSKLKFDFSSFLKSIFYVGKGTGNRLLSHFYDSALIEKRIMNNKQQTNQNRQISSKISRIIQIWNRDLNQEEEEVNGVVSLHCFHSISSDEALSREFLMIESIGIHNLTNIQNGSKKGIYLIDSLKAKKERRILGALFLFRAFKILESEGIRIIKRSDVR